ncbi:cold and drought-regulated protein CORA-like [Cucurbita moschata]|uniref:Cold and drought-regulated protein CORA-like n=1 Tax=Cucurbita moschata TaxID=3662 RepID=A0A6J1ERS8_CUCMO|nr:cold and drought-regulated protein CORA-like [Cucurbita moschata]
MSFKAFVFLDLFFAFVLLISSEVSARDLAKTSEKDNDEVEINGIKDAKYDRGYGSHDHGGYQGGGYGHGGYGGRRGYSGHNGHSCRYGRCGYRCCSYPGEVVEGAKP